MQTDKREISTFEVLDYMRSAFDDADVLDSVPLEAAGNPGAWHAWRTYRRQNGVVLPGEADSSTSKPLPEKPDDGTTTRRPGEWNWDGV